MRNTWSKMSVECQVVEGGVAQPPAAIVCIRAILYGIPSGNVT